MDKCKRFQYSELQVGSILCDGEFGSIAHILINKQPFLYESLLKHCSTTTDEQGTVKRLFNTARLQSLSHVNIFNVVSLVYEKDHHGLIYENAPYGSLNNFKAPEHVPWFWKIKTLYEILLGVDYLCTQTPPIYNVELRLENIFLGNGCAAKVYGYLLAPWRLIGYARTINTSCARRLAHIAPESWSDINYGITELNVVYAFGILMWELMHNKFAFNKLACSNVRTSVVEGKRPVWNLDGCMVKDALSLISIKCWAPNSESRPTIKQTIALLDSLMTSHKQLIEVAHSQLVKAVAPIIPLYTTIPNTDIILGPVVAKGSFGDIYRVTRGNAKYLCERLDGVFAKQDDKLWKDLKSDYKQLRELAQHPNILKAVELIFDSTNYINHSIVFEYVEYTNILDILQNPIPWIWKINAMNDIVYALYHLHNKVQPIGYFDLHLDNIYMDRSFHVKVCGYGLKTWVSESMDYSKKNTIAYIPPEAWHDINCTNAGARDIYAFGILMWEFLHCKRAYESLDLPQIRYMVCNGERPIWITENDTAKEQCAHISASCTSNNHESRPTSKELVYLFKDMRQKYRNEINEVFMQFLIA